jgi:hypothetical protein
MENRCENPYSHASSFWLQELFIMTYSISRKGIGLSAAIVGMFAIAPAANAVELEMSGHADRMVRAADNNGSGTNPAQGSDIQHLDNGADQSRLRMLGSQEFNNGYAGVDLEMRIGDTSECYDIKQKTATGGSGVGTSTGTACNSAVEWSRADAFYDAGWGRVSLGKGDSASRGSDRADLSGTDLVMNYDNRRNSGLSFYPTGGGNGVLGTYGQAFMMYEGDRSQNRARYDSPVFAGVKLSISNANTDRYAIGGTWATEEDRDFQVRVAAGYTALDTTAANARFETLTSISASALLNFGLNFTVGYGTAEAIGAGLNDQSNWHAKVGYKWDQFAIAVRYMDGSDIGGSTASADSIMVGFEYEANDWLDVYAGLEQASASPGNQVAGSIEDLGIATVGLRMSF